MNVRMSFYAWVFMGGGGLSYSELYTDHNPSHPTQKATRKVHVSEGTAC